MAFHKTIEILGVEVDAYLLSLTIEPYLEQLHQCGDEYAEDIEVLEKLDKALGDYWRKNDGEATTKDSTKDSNGS